MSFHVFAAGGKHLPASAARSSRPAGAPGFALVVVMVIFVVLYLVVYQLHFTTDMEARLAQVRYGDVESGLAQHSAALYVLTLLLEDLKQGGGGAGAAAEGATASTPGAPGAGGVPGPQGGDARGGGEGGGGNFADIAGPSGGASWYDYSHENIFSPNRQQVGKTSVKVLIADGESRLDLNRIWDYARLPGEEVSEGAIDVREEDLVGAVEGARSNEEAESNLRDKIIQRTRDRRTAGRAGGTEAGGRGAGGREAGEGEAAGGGMAGADDDSSLPADDYEPEVQFEPPDAERLDATRELLRRAILMVFSINEGNGYRYEAQYSPDRLADDIVQYLLERRQAPINNRLLLVSELLNVPGLTPEIFYGPMLAIPAGEALPVGDGFTLRRDEYGDLVAEYAYSDYDQAAQEQSRQELQQLQEQFGRFMDFPGLGLDRLQQNALTRGMSEPPVGVDEEGNEYIVEPPLPLGLEDIFTTFSTGKININTASVPVLFALLSSLTDEEANLVALDIRDYRNRFQEELPDEEGVETVEESKNPDLGQPKRRSQRDKEKEAAASGSVDAGTLPGAAGASGLPGLDALGMEGMESTYQNLETNYFTNLKQLELIDGTEGGPGDLLRSDEGVERVSDEQDTLLRRVERDLEKVAVFGSTYFNVELKGKPEKGRNVKTGYVTVRRDPQKGMIEILMWKELEK